MIGKTISHYKILEKLGEGGMGVVYKAQDTKLDRTVALKFLPRHLLCDEEAKAASALDHPNIATVYEIDEVQRECFISMAHIEGKSIKELIRERKRSVEEILEIAIQIAEGLNTAHKKDIVHRDIKPDNIMLTREGLVKIMDFGLAKLKGVSKVTKAGTTLGTVSYMSPEQARGEEVDHRTDIWSWGIVLYEMISGQLPFKGEYEQAVIYSILNDEPQPMKSLRSEVSVELEQIVKKALTKTPDLRYQKAEDMVVDLRSLREKLKSKSSKEKPLAKEFLPSVAVLPFRDMSAQKDQEYFCEGMAEELINALVKLEGLKVVARTSSFQFGGKDQDIRKIGEQLDVNTVLEGSVRKAGNKLRVTAQLINVSDGYHLWSEKYDRDMEDIFAIQDEISLAIVDKLKVKFLGKEKKALVKHSTENLEAYNLYLKGRYHWNKRTPKALGTAIEHFKEAIEMEPLYALAYTGLADCYTMLVQARVFRPNEGFPKAKAAAEKALEIDSSLGEAHASLGIIKWSYEWDWEGAENESTRAIELNPNYATAHQWHALLLAMFGKFEQAIIEIEKAQELDPLSPIICVAAGWLFFLRRQYDQAIEQSRKVLDIDPNFTITYQIIGWAYEQKGMQKEAIEEYLKGAASFGSLNAEQLRSLRKAYSISGYEGFWQKHIDISKQKSKRSYVPAYEIASMYARLRNRNQALEWLQKAFEERDSDMGCLLVDPYFDSLRTDPKFKNLLKKMGLQK